MLRRLWIVALGVTIAGCGQPAADAPAARLLPVTGIVSVDGEPAKGAHVTLHPLNANGPAAVTPSGVGDENGAFILTTFAPADGAPAGKYRITVSWAELLKSGCDPEYGKEKLPARYQSAHQSGLEFEIGAESADLLMLDLKSR